jgi:hypothetical protein
MRDYGKVHSKFWSSDTIRTLTDDGRLLALYLMTSPHTTIAGVFRLPDGYVCEDMQWTADRVAEAFRELLSKGFANRCETTKWVWIVKHLEWNPPENPNQRKSAVKVAIGVPAETCWQQEFMRVCGPSLGIDGAAKANPSLTLVKPLPNQEQEQEQDQKQEKESAAAQRASRPKREDITLKAYLEQCKAGGRKPLPADHPVRDYCQDAGITEEMLQVAWCVFRDDYTSGTNKAKRYKDWPGHFANAVRGCWAKLWFTDAGEVKWTSRGLQEKQVLETRMKAKETSHAA